MKNNMDNKKQLHNYWKSRERARSLLSGADKPTTKQTMPTERQDNLDKDNNDLYDSFDFNKDFILFENNEM